ncbi:MAG: hypothetical protein DMG76_26520, partial [Acidobacteria bacterium]
KENAFHRPHNSWLTEEVVHHVALAIVAGSRQAGSYSGPEVRIAEVRFRREWLALLERRFLPVTRRTDLGFCRSGTF